MTKPPVGPPLDQAAGLRRAGAQVVHRNPVKTSLSWPRLPALTITGGKGGVGKTCIAVNLACALAAQGQRILLVDFDLGLANADLLLGVNPQATLADVLASKASINTALTEITPGFDLLAAASGVEELTRLGEDRLRVLLLTIGKLCPRYDLTIIDTAAGIGPEVLTAIRCSRRAVVVATPDPTSLTDAYALIKIIEQMSPDFDQRLCINVAEDLHEAQSTYSRLRSVCERYLHRSLPLAGWVPRDPLMVEAVRRRSPLNRQASQLGPAAAAIQALATRMRGENWSVT